MPDATETLALHLLRSVYDETGGRPQTWRSVAGLGKGSDSEAPIQHAVDNGWLMVQGGHSVCLTDGGRRRAEA